MIRKVFILTRKAINSISKASGLLRRMSNDEVLYKNYDWQEQYGKG